MKNGLIFDLDGTLVDSLPGIADSLNRALSAQSLPTHSPSAVRGFVGNGSRILIERALDSGASEAEIDQVESAFKADYEISWPTGTYPYPEISELLETLQARQFPLAVLSNKPHPFTASIVAALFPHIQFTCILGQLPGIPHKPDPTGALEISAKFHLEAARCIIIGDSTIDLETAQNAGMQAIGVTWGFHDPERLLASGASHLAHDPSDLLEILLGEFSQPLSA